MEPFRWNLAKREQLGRLVESDPKLPPELPIQEFAECAAKIVARSEDRRLVFVGRSPESIFDYLSGVFSDTPWSSRLHLLNISNRFRSIESIKNEMPHAFQALRDHFEACHASPSMMVADPAGVSFCDLVSEGGTFEKVFELIYSWSRELAIDRNSLRKKLGFVGVTERRKNSPNTWRWQQHADWVQDHRVDVTNISISYRLWSYLGDYQPKVTKSNPPATWGTEEILLPPREESHVDALNKAYAIYRHGISDKRSFATRLARLDEFKKPWLRQLAHALK